MWINLKRLTWSLKKPIARFAETANRISFPGFYGMPISDVMSFFFKGLMNGAITTRASSVAYNFFIAVFPALIFMFTLIPYIPIEGFQTELLNLTKDVMPSEAFKGIKETLDDLIIRKRTDLLSLGFIMALIFSVNGISTLINAFNATYHNFENRSPINKWLISTVLVFIFSILIITATVLIIFSKMGREYLITNDILKENFTLFSLQIGRWVIIITLLLMAISFLYYFAPAHRHKWKFLSPGSITATLFVILSSLAFSFFVNNFANYNLLFGSLGTIIVLLLWMHINAIVLIIGFELNASISNVRLKKAEKNNDSIKRV